MIVEGEYKKIIDGKKYTVAYTDAYGWRFERRTLKKERKEHVEQDK